MQNNFYHVVIAAFLHDIGKVMQRAEAQVSEETKRFMEQSGPSSDGRLSHYHVQWTSEFIENNKHRFGLGEIEKYEDTVSQLAFRHHNPSTALQQIISEADRLSSGMDRGESTYERNVHKKKRMISLLSLMSMQGEPEKKNYCNALEPLTSADQSIYPNIYPQEEWLVDEYKKLWSYFERDWKQNNFSTPQSTLAYLDALYERYFWSVPANSTEDYPDSSLYEHSKISSALAGALYQYHEENNSLSIESVKDKQQEKFLFVVGDLSGIQKFIFQIAHLGGGKVAKRLRARSFLLEMLIQIIARRILDHAQLPFLNMIMHAGGNFYLLLPNTGRIRSLLINTETDIQSWLQSMFHGEISLNLASISLKGDDFFQKKIGKKFEELSEALVQKKYRQLHTYLIDKGKWSEDRFLVPEAKIQRENATGIYEMPFKVGDVEINDEDIGKLLTKRRCLAVYDNNEGDYPLLDWSFSLQERGDQLKPGAKCILSFEKEKEKGYSDTTVPIHYLYKALHVPLYESNQFKQIDQYMQDHPDEEPIYPGQILSFQALAQESKGTKNISYLKADIDNLGYILNKGLDWHPVGWTLSKKATFSRLLELFFSGRIRNLLDDRNNQNPDFKLIYTVFSGGDDLFLIGPWNVLHDFSRTLQKEWEAYTGYNPYLTLSVGLAMTRPMTPLWAATDEAEDALDHAKSNVLFPRNKPKNQICSFSHLVKWEEMDAINQHINKLSAWIEEGIVSTAFVRSLILFSNLAKFYWESGRIEGLRYLPLMSYNSSRNLTKDEHEPVRQWLENFKDPNCDLIRHLGFIAHYSLLLNRT